MSASLVVEASKFTLDPPKPDDERYQRLKKIRAGLLPAETAARSEVDRAIAELERAERAETKGKRLGLSILSPEIFSWKKGGLPAFAVFDLHGQGVSTISTNPAKVKIPSSCKSFYEHYFAEPLTRRVEKFFSAHFKLLWCLAAILVEVGYFYKVQALAATTVGRFLLGFGLGILASFCVALMGFVVLVGAWTLLVRERERTATARFSGVIPDSVRARIKQCEGEFSQMIIVAEANWDLGVRRKGMKLPSSCDPLVVGWDGDYFWVVTCFNTSALEQLVADEYAVKPDNLH